MVGVIGSGSFGITIGSLLAKNQDVLLYTRSIDAAEQINNKHHYFGWDLPTNLVAITDMEELANKCEIIFPIVPSSSFREMMQSLAPYLHPYHILIHGTKGFDIREVEEGETLGRKHIRTISEVIKEESVVLRIGVLSGPNLAKEIMVGQPTAAVIASNFQEVIKRGKAALNSNLFQVFGTNEVLGTELCGALKNTVAVGSGILGGMGMGKNIQALLITRGLTEMIAFGRAMGASPKAFVGTAGIGDLICTATSEKSRNYSFGMRLGNGETLEAVQKTMPELAEGIRTLKIARHLANYYDINVPITEILYRVVYEGLEIEKAITYLMRYPNYVDVDFI